ncbi:MAG: S-layer homology domain-containing protein [Cytobacillus gottheilii]|uniref:S-layer homology domain-containing protein n=1 Tax=Cytobacillus gottheilii TaxID=859144 RepID=UPI003464B380
MDAIYVKIFDKDVEGYISKLFSDKVMISAFASNAVTYAVDIDIIYRYSNGTFGPSNYATRASVAKVTVPFIKIYKMNLLLLQFPSQNNHLL